MPSSSLGVEDIFAILTEPVFKGVLRAPFREIRASPRPENLIDESVGSFISRRFGAPLADNIVSALYHGVYAGDIYNLSARSLLPNVWLAELRYGSIIRARINHAPEPRLEEDFLAKKKVSMNMVNTSIFTLNRGLGLLADTLVAKLEKNPNVTIRREAQVDMLGGSNWNPGMKV